MLTVGPLTLAARLPALDDSFLLNALRLYLHAPPPRPKIAHAGRQSHMALGSAYSLGKQNHTPSDGMVLFKKRDDYH